MISFQLYFFGSDLTNGNVCSCRSSEDHEHASRSLSKSPTVGEYQVRAPSQDSSRWVSSRGDLVGQGSVSRSRDVADPSLFTFKSRRGATTGILR
jgi:hypothetical protein